MRLICVALVVMGVTLATKISVVPTAMVMITGIRAEQPYLRGLLDLVGVQPDFMTCGAFKSAGEMFMRSGPSEEADQMTDWLLDSMYETTVDLIADGRGVSADKVRGWIDDGLYTADQAQQAGIIDAVQFRQDVTAYLKAKYGDDLQFEKKYGKKKPEQIDLSSPLGLVQLWAKLLAGPAKPRAGKTAIAVVYVDGAIMPGRAEPSPFGTGGIAYSTPIARALDDALAQAAKEAGLEKYEVRVLSKPKNFMEQLLSDLGGEETEEADDTISLSRASLPTTPTPSFMEAALPYLEGCDPQRVRAIKSALQRLAMLERESVILSMPEIRITD